MSIFSSLNETGIPKFFWYTILSEIASHIKDNHEECRDLFTRSPDKIDILIEGTADNFPLNELKKRLIKLVPINLDFFLPKWSTATADSNLACIAAFADAVSPYYNYMLYLCGFNSIRVEGEIEEWERIAALVDELSGVVPGIRGYLIQVSDQLKKFVGWVKNDDIENLKKIFYTEHCGSGSQKEVKGWFTNFYVEYPSLGTVGNFSSHIARVPFRDLSRQQDFNLNYGLFSSKTDNDGFWIPQFDQVVNRKLEEPIPVEQPKHLGMTITSYPIGN